MKIAPDEVRIVNEGFESQRLKLPSPGLAQSCGVDFPVLPPAQLSRAPGESAPLAPEETHHTPNSCNPLPHFQFASAEILSGRQSQ